MMATAKVNGAELYYEESGSGPPIILSAGGLQGVASSYAPVIDTLSQEHRVVVYDRRFGGQSRSPLVVQTWDMVCDDVFGLMDALGIEQAYLGGGSFGAAISLGCAVRRPERVRAIFPSKHRGRRHLRRLPRGQVVQELGHGGERRHRAGGGRLRS